MNVWKLTAAKTLVHANENLSPEEGKFRVRVTKVFVNEDDALIYGGVRRVKYPRVLGRFAVGVVADDGGIYAKGTRLLLHSFRNPLDLGTEARDYSASDKLVCGVTVDGYLRDFVWCGVDDVTPLPDSVNDERGLLTEHIAVAKRAIEALSPAKGDHVAVIGADLLGILVCQLLIYQQVSPALIDDNADRLEFARDCGIYYAFPSDSRVLDNMAEVTGGRLADGVICTTATTLSGSLPFAVCADGKSAVFCGFNESGASLPLQSILSKQITVHGISDSEDYVETAINLIANKALDLTPFRANVLQAGKLAALLKDYEQRPNRLAGEINVVNLL